MRIVLLGNKAAGAGNGLAAYRYLMRKFMRLSMMRRVWELSIL